MGRPGDDKEFLVPFFCTLSYDMLPCHPLEGIFAEIAAVCLLAMDEKHGSINLCGPGQQRLVQETLAADDVPAVVGVAAALVIASGCLVISMVILDKPRRILGKGVAKVI